MVHKQRGNGNTYDKQKRRIPQDVLDEFLVLKSYEKSGSKYAFKQYQYKDKTAEIEGPKVGKKVWVRQPEYDMCFYRRYLEWKPEGAVPAKL